MRLKVIGVLAGIFFNMGSLQANAEEYSVSAGLGSQHFSREPQSPLIISDWVADSLHLQQKKRFPQLFASFKKKYFETENKDALFPEWALGPALYYEQIHYLGDVWELNDPQFNNYNYDFFNRSLNIFAEGEFSLPPFSFMKLQPFVIAGLGMSANATQYNDWAKPGIAVDSELHLTRKHTLQFAYELGAGLMVAVTKKTSLSLRYNYQDSGKATTPVRFNLIKPLTLRLISHSALFGVHYLV